MLHVEIVFYFSLQMLHSQTAKHCLIVIITLEMLHVQYWLKRHDAPRMLHQSVTNLTKCCVFVLPAQLRGERLEDSPSQVAQKFREAKQERSLQDIVPGDLC